MTREIKLALILGSALALVVGVLVSDHLSAARTTQISEVPGELGKDIGKNTRIASAHRDPNADWQQIVATLEPHKIEQPKPVQLAQASTQKPQQVVPDPDKRLIDEAARSGVTLIGSLVQTDTIQTGAPAAPAALPPGFKEHVVREGDSLWTIALKYYGEGRQFPRIEEANQDALAVKRGLSIGQKLRIPIVEPETKVAATPAKADEQVPNDPNSAKYVVKSGDTLQIVARKTLGSDKRWEEILAMNSGKITSPEALSIGMELRIPQR